MQDNKIGKLISVIIILAAGFLALYVITNGFAATDNEDGQLVSAKILANDEEDALQVNTEFELEAEDLSVTTIMPTQTEAVMYRNLNFYVDKNQNLIKDEGDVICQACIGRSGVFAKPASSNGVISQITSVNIATGAKVSEKDIADSDQVWGAIADRSILIPPQMIALGDGVSDVNIAAHEIVGVVSAINANADQANVVNGQVVYRLSKLIPSMKAAFEKQADVWVKYTPDTNKLAEYYLASAKLTAIGETFEIRVGWRMAANAANANKLENIEFIVK